MRITHNSDFGHLPEPVRVHKVSGIPEIRTLNDVCDFGEKVDTILGKLVGIKIHPRKANEIGNRFTLLHGSSNLIKERIALDPGLVKEKNYRLILEQEGYTFEVIEHIVGVLRGLHILDADICITLDNRKKSSWPSQRTGQQEYAEALYDASSISETEPDFFTVTQPINFNFGGKRNTRMSFLPPEPGEEGKCFIDVNVDYSQRSIGGKQRMIFDTADTDTFLKRVAPSRTPSYGWKTKLINAPDGVKHFLRMFPQIPSGLEPEAVFQIFDDTIGNPRKIYRNLDGEKDTQWMELLYHEILDKLGALGINFFNGKYFSGTIVFEQSSHATDLQALTALSGESMQEFIKKL